MEQRKHSELTLVQLLQILRRRSRLIIGGGLFGLVLGATLCVVLPKRYQASGSIEVQTASRDGLDRSTMMGSGPAPSDPIDNDITIQTQARVLQSNTLALRTIRKMNLASLSEFQPKQGWIENLNPIPSLFPQPPTKPSADAIQMAALRTFSTGLEVKPITGTRLMNVAYTSTDPKLAADIVNSLVHELTDYADETKQRSIESVTQMLRQELTGLRAQSESLQAKVAGMQQESGIYSIGTTDPQGRQQAYSAVLDQFQRAATTLSDAAQNRVLKQAIFEAAQNGDPELLSGLAGNSLGLSVGSGINNALVTIQQLRSQEASLQGQLDQLKVKFGMGYPKLAELQGNIDSVRTSIQSETRRVADRAKNDYMVANQTWKNAFDNYQTQKIQADGLNNKTIKYMIARQEADESRTLYLDLLKRLKEVGVLQSLKSNSVSVVDEALIPMMPKSPNVILLLVGVMGVGLFLGTMFAMYSDLVDDRVIDVTSIEQIGAPLLGMLPGYGSTGIEVLERPVSRYSDAIRGVRWSLHQTNRLSKVIMVTASLPSTEKAMLSINLAASAAQAGKNVLLVEGDMRNPTIRRLLNLKSGVGLGQVLMGDTFNGNVARFPELPNLQVLPSDPKPPNPSALIESDRMAQLVRSWRSTFDLVIIDGPAALPHTDVKVLSQLVDATIQLVEQGTTSITSVKRTREALGELSVLNSFVVIGGLTPDSHTYLSYYGLDRPASKLIGELS